MKIIEIKDLTIPELKVISYARFRDARGYFTEPYRLSDLYANSAMESFRGSTVVQCNESYSLHGTIRGLHFQWDPPMGKLVRTVSGHMIDLALDIRKGSPSFGRLIAYDMPSNLDAEYGEWIWVPPGFAHGNVFLQDTVIEYLCTGEYNQASEDCISPLSQDIDWSLCDKRLENAFKSAASTSSLITEKDRFGLSVEQWNNNPRSMHFIYRDS